MGAQYTSSVAESAFDGTMMGEHLNTPNDIKGMPFFPTGTASLLHKCLTPAIWNTCKDRRDKFGFTFR